MDNLKQNGYLDVALLESVYNFIYRLSGNTTIAGVITKKALLMYPNNRKDIIFLLKQAWGDFLEYYGSLEFKGDIKGEDPIQQTLLALAPEARCALVLRDILGYSYGQIAFITDKPEAEVARLISVGRRGFKKSKYYC